MNKTLIVALLVLNLAFSNANFLKNTKKETPQFTIFNQLEQIESSDFG